MKAQTLNETGDSTLLFVMGLGNRLDGTNEKWMIDRLADAGYRVHAVQLSTDITNFTHEYLIPLQRIHDEQGPSMILSHSLGGLVTVFLDTPARKVYLSPWWGIYEEKVAGWEEWLVPRLPIEARILPSKTRRDEIGPHLPDEDWDRLPKRLSPVFVTEIHRAQQNLPSVDEHATVFASLEDTIISLTAIGKAVSSDQIRLYDGEHQIFSARDRYEIVDEILGEL